MEKYIETIENVEQYRFTLTDFGGLIQFVSQWKSSREEAIETAKEKMKIYPFPAKVYIEKEVHQNTIEEINID